MNSVVSAAGAPGGAVADHAQAIVAQARAEGLAYLELRGNPQNIGRLTRWVLCVTCKCRWHTPVRR
ncbi:MAG: hypothetical protein IPN53_25665 [Comamonadaceae bacterium]|nr:hypothetical protein [Comamonadaceae bacterium]